MSRRFDAIVIGAGQAGPPMAGRLARAGKTVAIIERKLFGGTCVNVGCTPTKTLVASAYAAHLARRAADYGVSTGPVGVNFAAVMARMKKVVDEKREGLESWLRSMANCKVFEGHARFVSAHAIEVAGETFEADWVFINVGGRAVIPDFPGVDHDRALTNSTLLELDAVPRHLAIVGGSYIGARVRPDLPATRRRRHRDREGAAPRQPRGPRRLGRDPRRSWRRKASRSACDAECIRFAPRGADIEVGVDCQSGEPAVVGSHVLLAVGRRPNTDDLGLDAAGVAVDARGYVVVDDDAPDQRPAHLGARRLQRPRRLHPHRLQRLRDCRGEPPRRRPAQGDRSHPVYALYVDPPLGRVGLTETEAKAKGHAVRVGKRPMTRVARAVEKGETQGFMKVVVDGKATRSSARAILGAGGDEAIHGVIEAMAAGDTATAYTRVVAIHPTVSELVPTVFEELSP